MRDKIKKILKEQEDEFDWVRGLDVDAAEREIKQGYVASEHDWGFDGSHVYNRLVKAGFHDLEELKSLGNWLHDELQIVYDNGHDSAWDSDYRCDGCCDDYVWYEDHETRITEVSENRYNDGYEDGMNRGKEEVEEDLKELNGKIQELESELEYFRNTRNEG